MTIIDVRDPKEVENGSIPSAVNVPLNRLADVLAETYPDGAFQKVSVACGEAQLVIAGLLCVISCGWRSNWTDVCAFPRLAHPLVRTGSALANPVSAKDDDSTGQGTATRQ